MCDLLISMTKGRFPSATCTRRVVERGHAAVAHERASGAHRDRMRNPKAAHRLYTPSPLSTQTSPLASSSSAAIEHLRKRPRDCSRIRLAHLLLLHLVGLL